ncbi:MAG: hypothetical protein JOZ58_28090 [Acetobacteraceae bacterium]|nr:hypothetical protein [Acetobacteraceae bacterium]
MSDRELARLRVMVDLADGRLTVDAAAALMRIGRLRLTGCAARSQRTAQRRWPRANAAARAIASTATHSAGRR